MSPKARQSLVGLGSFEVLTLGNRFPTDPILRVSPMQFPPMVPAALDTMILSLAPMPFVIKTALIGIQPPLVPVGNTVLHAVDFGYRRETFPPFQAPDVMTGSMDESVGPDDLSAPAILLGKAMNLSFKVRFHGQQCAIVIPLDLISVSHTILQRSFPDNPLVFIINTSTDDSSVDYTLGKTIATFNPHLDGVIRNIRLELLH